MLPYFTEHYGNPSSPHRFGQRAHVALNDARKTIATTLGVKQQEVIFMSSATESIHTAVRGIPHAGGHIITTSTEHSAVIEACALMEARGCTVTYLTPNTDGVISLQQVEQALQKDTTLVSVHYINNETGAIQPLAAIGQLLKEHTALFHVDATQAFLTQDCTMDYLQWDMITLAGHKLHAPKGVGILGVREQINLTPLITGSQEFSVRGGTQSVPLAVGLATAMKLGLQEKETTKQHYLQLKKQLTSDLLSLVPDTTITGAEETTSEAIVHVRFAGISGETLMTRLDIDGIAVATGSACSSSEAGPSRVLLAMGIPEEDAVGSIRISFSKWNTLEEIEKLTEAIAYHVGQIRHMNITY